MKWKEARAALSKQAPDRSQKSVATGRPVALKAQRASPSAEQMELGEGWNHVVRGGRVAKASKTPPANPHPNPPPEQVTMAPEQPKVTATRETARPQPEPKSSVAPKRAAEKPKKSRETARPQKPEPKSTVAPKRTAGKSKKKADARVKTAAAKRRKVSGKDYHRSALLSIKYYKNLKLSK